jgi:hypothetical protein
VMFFIKRCQFMRAWAGQCASLAFQDGFCERHQKKRCWCGKQATSECPEATSLVCGAPLCDEHVCQRHGCRISTKVLEAKNGQEVQPE